MRDSFNRKRHNGVQLGCVPFAFAAPLGAGAINRNHDQQGVWPRQVTGVHWRVVVRDINDAYQCFRDADEACVVRLQGSWVLFRPEE
ncbi:proline--tRNA ligase [Streptomyces azureus]|uniref:Proline--tRNA ligase n=1 Tax=Streptomyces azureus TaxID=146537 RepID=A0A0K8PC55_STRAJ|nr:proline--tRNA ligase [Streptomyces azureus]